MYRIPFLLLVLTICTGCIDPSKMNSGEAEQADANPAEAPVAAQQPNAQPAVPQPQGFSQIEWKLVDKNKVLAENPKLVEVENKNNASDPFSAAAQSYFTIGSKAHLLAFKHNVDIHKAQYDKNPTFDEFNTMMKSAGVDLKGLYPWQVYAYDEKDGTIVILEDREEKKRLHDEAGVAVPE